MRRLPITACVAVLFAAAPAAGQPVGRGGLVPLSPDLVPIASRLSTGTVSVRNAGGAPAAASIATLQCQRQGGGSCVRHPDFARYEDPLYPNRLVFDVPALPSGHVFNFAMPFWAELAWAPGSYNLLLQADAAIAVPESNEANNFGGYVLVKP